MKTHCYDTICITAQLTSISSKFSSLKSMTKLQNSHHDIHASVSANCTSTSANFTSNIIAFYTDTSLYFIQNCFYKYSYTEMTHKFSYVKNLTVQPTFPPHLSLAASVCRITHITGSTAHLSVAMHWPR